MTGIAVVCRQGAVRSTYVATRLRSAGIEAAAYGAEPDRIPVFPLTRMLAAARGVALDDRPRLGLHAIPPEWSVLLLDGWFFDDAFRTRFPDGRLINVPELDVTGMHALQAVAAINAYFDRLDVLVATILLPPRLP